MCKALARPTHPATLWLRAQGGAGCRLRPHPTPPRALRCGFAKTVRRWRARRSWLRLRYASAAVHGASFLGSWHRCLRFALSGLGRMRAVGRSVWSGGAGCRALARPTPLPPSLGAPLGVQGAGAPHTPSYALAPRPRGCRVPASPAPHTPKGATLWLRQDRKALARPTVLASPALRFGSGARSLVPRLLAPLPALRCGATPKNPTQAG